MCGIVGYAGARDAAPVIHESLKKLEYRGYDSFGLATLDGDAIHVSKGVGKISDSQATDIHGNIGIGHSRWATHGNVSKRNAHPHTDCSGRLVVVHNGIIENHQDLRKELESKGHVFRSQTDTEIIPHLIEEYATLGFEKAVMSAVRKLKGRYAIAVLFAGDRRVIGVRRGSPLIVGKGKNETFIASDIPAFLEHTKNVMYLDDNEMVVADGEARFFNVVTGEPVEKRVIEIDWDAAQAEKGDYPHFLIKEIMEQKDTIMRAINQNEELIQKTARAIKDAHGTFFTGCGTAGKVCKIGEYAFSRIAGKHVNSVVSSEFPNYKNFLTDKTLMITVSQSGETADVMEAVEAAKKKGVKIISLVNVMGSSLQRVSDYSFLINAGPEKAVASTKVTTAQIALLILLSYAVDGRLKEGKTLLLETAAKVNDMLNPRYEERLKDLASRLRYTNNIYLIGRSLNYPVALEGAIKIMELSNIHAQGFAGGEIKHGPLALIENGSPVIAIVSNDGNRDEILSNAMEVKARGAYVIGISPQNNDVFDFWIRVPDVGDAAPIVNIIPIQILAYHLAVLRGCDPDYCRNLAKSVTVK